MVEMNRVSAPFVGDKAQLPLVGIRHFENRKHFCEIIFHTGDIHFVQKNKVYIVVVTGIVNTFKNFCFIEVFGKFIEEAEKLGSVTP